MAIRPSRSWSRLIGPSLMTLVMLLVLLALGSWQVHRLHWKLAILAQIAQAEAAPPIPLPPTPRPFTKVDVTGHLRNDLAAHYGAEVRNTQEGPQLGTFLIEPLERPDGSTILVDLGWLPQQGSAPVGQPQEPTTIIGFIHAPETAGLFSAKDDPASRTFYTLDPVAIGAALGIEHVAPFILVALGPQPPEHWPDPARHLPRPPNNHLSYAITWYGLAVALVVIFFLWARRTLHV